MIFNRTVIVIFSLFFPLLAFASKAHEHGKAQLMIAAEGNQVFIELESPADNLLGFEHRPKTAKQKAQVKQVLQRLGRYHALVDFAWPGCEQVDAKVESPFAHKHAHEHKHSHHHGHHDEESAEGHADFHLSYSLKCSQLTLPATLEVTAFKSFHRFDEIDVKWVVSGSQGSQKTSAAAALINIQ